MKPIRTTDYLAAIPYVPFVGLLMPNVGPGLDPLLKVPKLAQPMPPPMSDQAFHQRVAADFSLIALVAIAAITVGIVVLNWSR
jgi:hypothetical protein